MGIPTVIFSGGQGTRMKEETEFRPKPMVSVGGMPILWHIMKIYSHFGHNEFIIALGYKGDYIKQYFLNQEYLTHDLMINTKSGEKKVFKDGRKIKDDFNITFVDTGVETMTGERLLRVKSYVNSDIFMVTYGDGVSDIDINALIEYHKDKKVIGTITGVHPRSKWGLIDSDESNIIREFRQKPVLHEYVNGGFMVFNKDVFNYIKPKETIEEVMDKLVLERKLAVYPYDGYWSAMDTYQDLEEMNRQWKKDPKWKVWR